MISYKTVLIATIIGILPFFIWFFLVYTNSQTKKWKTNFILKIFFIGVLTAIPASVIEIFYSEFQNYSISNPSIELLRIKYANFSALVSAVLIEEIAKGIGIIYLLLKAKFKKILRPNAGLIIGFLVGLSFAITENGVYFANSFNQENPTNLIQIIFLRFILSTTAHLVYSGIFGFYWGKYLMRKKVRYSILAILIPSLIHFAFNFSLELNLGYLSIIIIIISLVILIQKFIKNRNINEN